MTMSEGKIEWRGCDYIMKFHYAGKFDGNQDSLPHGEHMEGAVAFREPEDPKKMAIVGNVGAGIMYVFTIALLFIRGGYGAYSFVGILLSFVAPIPHELLHAICFKEDVYMYENLKQGMMFVVGPETMSRSRFVFMSLFPNIVFGFLPFVLFLIQPEWNVLGSMGAFSIPMGFGDYMNVFNALTQMPKEARTYLYKFHSYWYMP